MIGLPKTFLTSQLPKIKIEEDDLNVTDLLMHFSIVFLFSSISFVAALVLSNYGYSFADALVESVSAITTTGDSPKVLTPALPLIPKFLLGVLMLLGRMEIVPIFVAFSRVKGNRGADS